MVHLGEHVVLRLQVDLRVHQGPAALALVAQLAMAPGHPHREATFSAWVPGGQPPGVAVAPTGVAPAAARPLHDAALQLLDGRRFVVGPVLDTSEVETVLTLTAEQTRLDPADGVAAQRRDAEQRIMTMASGVTGPDADALRRVLAVLVGLDPAVAHSAAALIR